MNWRTSHVLSVLLLVTAMSGQAWETDTFVVTDLTGHLTTERQETLTR